MKGTRKLWYLLLVNFWLLLSKFDFWREYWALGCVSTQIWDFSDVSYVPKILSLKWFRNSWSISQIKFVIADVTLRFTVANRTCTKSLYSSKILWPRLPENVSLAFYTSNNVSSLRFGSKKLLLSKNYQYAKLRAF